MGTCASIQTAMSPSTLNFEDVTLEKKREAILNKIKSEPKIVDLKITFYMAACDALSSKGATLIPSPREYLRKQPLKEAVEEVNEYLPNLRLLRLYLERPESFELPDDAVSLLYWLLVRLKEPCLQQLNDLTQLPIHPLNDKMRKADIALKVCYSTMSSKYMEWRCKSYGEKTGVGYRVVKLEDLHGSLHCGVRRLVGDAGGLTLHSKLDPCFSELTPVWTWGKSCLGTQMSVIMLVEFADNSEKVLKLVRHQQVIYYISDPTYARIRYLLIWINAPPAKVANLQVPMETRRNIHFLLSSLILVSSLFLPKEAPNLLQSSLYTLSCLGERLLKRH